MKFKGLDGRQHTLDLSQYKVNKNHTGKCSSLHEKARNILLNLYPMDLIYEEVVLPGSKNLRADFFLPTQSLIVEVQGQQHDNYSNHFHENTTNFLKSMQRDKKKKEWCDINGLELLELPYNKVEEWEQRILKR